MKSYSGFKGLAFCDTAPTPSRHDKPPYTKNRTISSERETAPEGSRDSILEILFSYLQLRNKSHSKSSGKLLDGAIRYIIVVFSCEEFYLDILGRSLQMAILKR